MNEDCIYCRDRTQLCVWGEGSGYSLAQRCPHCGDVQVLTEQYETPEEVERAWLLSSELGDGR